MFKCISISASGQMGFYCAGVLEYILEHFNVDECLFSGSSSGALLGATVVAFQQRPSDIIAAFTSFCNARNHTNEEIADMIVEFLQHYISDNTSEQEQDAILERANQRLYVHYSTPCVIYAPILTLKVPIGMRLDGHLQHSWQSLDDLYESLARSSSIPLVTSTWKRALLQGCDGGFTDMCPQLNEDKKWSESDKTLPFRTTKLSTESKNFIITENRWRKVEFWKKLVIVLEQNVTKQLYNLGYNDAKEHHDEIASEFNDRASTR